MTKIKNLRKVLLLCALLLAIAIGSLFAIAQPQTAPTAHAEGETSATLTGKEKIAHVTLSDLFPTGYTANDKIEIVDGDTEIGTLTVDKDASKGFSEYSFKADGLYTFKPNNEYNVKKFIYVAPTGNYTTFSLVNGQPSSAYMSLEKPTTAEKELINASFPNVKWDSNNANAHGVVIDSSYYNDTQNPYVFNHYSTLKFGDIFLIYEESGNYTKTYDCTNDKNTSPATVKVGDATFSIRYEGAFNKGYPAYGDGSFKITICPVPGYVINYVIFTSSIDNPFDASELRFPGLEATYENGNLKVTGMQPGETYELFSGGSAQGLLTSITVNYIEHEHTGVYEPGSDETHHFDHCVCLWRVNEEEHDFGEGEITVEPTYQRKGTVKYTCAECGYEKEEKVAPNLADTEITSEDLFYTGKAQFAKYTVTYKGQTLASWGTYYKVSGTNSAKTPGTYTFTIIPKDGSIFEGEKEVTFTIKEGNYDMSAVVFEDMTVDYNGTEQSILATNLPDGVKATYEGNGQIKAGEYIVTAKFTSEADDAQYYNPIADMTAKLIINKISVATPTADSTVFTYNGQSQTYTLATSALYNISDYTATNAGNYKAKVALSDKNNYQWENGNSDDLEYSFIINKATLAITAESKEVTYGDDVPAYTATYAGFVNGETETVLNGELAFDCKYVKYSNVGNYSIVASGITSDNYEISYVEANVIVTAKELVLSWENTKLIYNGQDQQPIPILEGLLNGDSCEVTTITGSEKDVGASYIATATALSNANYKLPANATASFSIVKAQANITVATTDINVIYGDPITIPEATTNFGEVIVEKTEMINVGEYIVTYRVAGTDNYDADSKEVRVIISAKEVAEPTVNGTYTYTGAEQTVVLDGLEAFMTVANDKGTIVGDYVATITLDSNHKWANGSDGNVQWSIAKATYDMRAVVFEDSTVIYNGSQFSIIATNLPTGVTATYEGNAQTVVGEYTITASFAGDATNYNAIANMTATLTINKATYDMSAVVFEDSTVTYNGNAFSIIATNLPTGVTATYDGNAQTVVGEYTITASFAGDATNYNAIADMTATLTINKATYDMSGISIANKTVAYDGQAHSIAIAGTLPTGVSVSYANNAKTEVGVYTVTASFAGDATNYNAISSMSAVLTIKAVVVENDLKDETTGKPVVSIEKEDGFAPNTELEVSPFEEGMANAPVNITKKEEILGAYKLTLKQDDTDVDPDGTIVVKMLIPESALGRNFRIAHVQDGIEAGQVEYTIEDGYAVIETEELGEFVFVCEKDGLSGGAIAGIVIGSVIFLLILLFVVLFVVWKKFNVKPFAFLIPTYRKINKKFFNNELNDFEAKNVKIDKQSEIQEEENADE